MTDSRFVPCPACLGDCGFDRQVGIDHNTGAAVTRWEPCELCLGQGEIEQEVEPFTEADLDDLDSD